MSIEICVNYKNLDWVFHITDYKIQPEEPQTYWHPGCPSEVDVLDGWVELDGKPSDIENPTGEEIDLLYREVTDNKELFYEILESEYEHIEEDFFQYVYETERDYDDY